MINLEINDRYFLSKKEYQYSGDLFKYMSNMDYIREAILNKTIYLSHPSLFNDPFDCASQITPDSIKEIRAMPSLVVKLLYPCFTEYYHELNELEKKIQYPEKIETTVSKVFQDKVRHMDIYTLMYLNYCKIQYLSNGEQYPKPIFDPDIKVCCFSKTRSSFPMWAHYANNYKGACLEYDARNVRLSLDCDVPDYAFNNVQYVDNFKTDNRYCFKKCV